MLMRLFLTLLSTMMAVSIAAAEPHDCSWAKHPERVVSQQTVKVGPVGHEVVYTNRLDRIDKSTMADWVGGQAWIFGVSDQTNGTGSHSGWYEWVGKSSDKMFGTYRGTHVTDGSVRTWRGTFDIAGGTGRYEKATGGGDYKGRAAPDAFEESGACTISY